MIPVDFALNEDFLAACREWRRGDWGELAPWPGLEKARKLWLQAAPLREVNRAS